MRRSRFPSWEALTDQDIRDARTDPVARERMFRALNERLRNPLVWIDFNGDRDEVRARVMECVLDKLFENKFKDKRGMSGYVNAIVRSRKIDWLRDYSRKANRQRPLDEPETNRSLDRPDPLTGEIQSSDADEREDRLRRMNRCIEKLTAGDDRRRLRIEVLIAHETRCVTFIDLGREYGKNEKTMRRWAQRALKELRRCLDHAGPASPDSPETSRS